MAQTAPLIAIGMMSGTSMDGIDAAMLRTDGVALAEPMRHLTVPYTAEFRRALHSVLGGKGPVERVGEALTRLHAAAIEQLLAAAGMVPGEIDVIGFHGHTILHAPDRRRTWQIGDGARLAAMTGIDVVGDFRSNDVAAGGEGAPFAPIYHAAVAPAERPVCILNIGGVANVTWLGSGAVPGDAALFDDLLAFDTGPGNALIDDWVTAHCGVPYDRDGALAASGTVDGARLATLMANSYFDQAPPKSLDRDAFSAAPVQDLSPADGAATLTAFTVASVARAAEYLPSPPVRWIVTGGGRRNGHLMDELAARLGAPVVAIEDIGVDGDALEAQAFAYLAVRSLRGLPLSGPSTTGVSKPTTGGRVFAAP